MYFPALCKQGLAWGRAGLSSRVLAELGRQGLECEVTLSRLPSSFPLVRLLWTVSSLSSDQQPPNGIDEGGTAPMLQG